MDKPKPPRGFVVNFSPKAKQALDDMKFASVYHEDEHSNMISVYARTLMKESDDRLNAELESTILNFIYEYCDIFNIKLTESEIVSQAAGIRAVIEGTLSA